MVKFELIKSGNSKGLKNDVDKWLQDHPNVKILKFQHYSSGGALWTSILYDE